MKTVLHRGDHSPDYQLCCWQDADAERLATALGVRVYISAEDPRALVIEAGQLFGPDAIAAHIDLDALKITTEYQPDGSQTGSRTS